MQFLKMNSVGSPGLLAPIKLKSEKLHTKHMKPQITPNCIFGLVYQISIKFLNVRYSPNMTERLIFQINI